MKLNPYLTFAGKAEEAMTFYAGALDGTVTGAMRFGEMPKEDQFPGMDPNGMAHIRVDFANGDSLMASDDPNPDHAGFHNVTLQTAWDTPEGAKVAFDKLAAGGEVIMPCDKTFWARAFGMCRDKYGVRWMVNCD